jgi:hypothetical protein
MDRDIHRTDTDPLIDRTRPIIREEPSAMAYLAPLIVAVAVVMGLVYYFSGPTVPNANRADTAVTKSEPSPN